MEETVCCIVCHKDLPEGMGRFHTPEGSMCLDCHEEFEESDTHPRAERTGNNPS